MAGRCQHQSPAALVGRIDIYIHQSTYVAKIVHVIFDVDRMVGGDFEEGLAKMKAIAER
jgi:hypothetical protein